MDTKKLYTDVYQPDGHNYGAYGCTPDAAEQFSKEIATVKKYLQLQATPAQAVVIEVGCGLGHLSVCHPNWKGFEYSPTAMGLAKQLYGDTLNIAEGDGRNLPLAANSVDFLYTFSALEHIPEVERAFGEMERVLKSGGMALLRPAWNCRPWTVKKLQQRPYGELKLPQKLGKLLIPLRENVLFRMVCAMPMRLLGEWQLATNKKPLPLRYQKLAPEFDLWDRYEHIPDDDAFVNMDAHAALVYFASRGWRSVSHPSFSKRIFCRSEEVVVQKP